VQSKGQCLERIDAAKDEFLFPLEPEEDYRAEGISGVSWVRHRRADLNANNLRGLARSLEQEFTVGYDRA